MHPLCYLFVTRGNTSLAGAPISIGDVTDVFAILQLMTINNNVTHQKRNRAAVAENNLATFDVVKPRLLLTFCSFLTVLLLITYLALMYLHCRLRHN